MNTAWINLSFLVWLPILFGVLVYIARHAADGWLARIIARVTVIVTTLGALSLACAFDTTSAAPQFVEVISWIPNFNINYALGADGISMLFVLVNAVITCVAVFACKEETPNGYLAALLITSGLTVGAFTALDGVLFYVFFEAMLIPVFLLIGIFGAERRRVATLKFFLFTLFGSLFMLLALFTLYGLSDSFSIADWSRMSIDRDMQCLIFVFFMLAFMVKTPMFPFHGWAPDAYSQGPAAAIVMLAATKIGAYAMLRLALPIVPDAAHWAAQVMIALSLFAIIYFALVARAQTDMKKLVAYSTVAHMGMVTLGFFAFNLVALKGAILLMVANALVAAALFLSTDFLSARYQGSRAIADYKGVANKMPAFATLFVFFAMANVALPGTSGFVGELLVIIGVIKMNLAVGVLAATVLILAAFYMLWLVRQVIFGAANKTAETLNDLNCREKWVLGILAAAILLFGVYPQPLLALIDVSAGQMLELMMQTKM
jgi:NADH-quinone oxidoreductase subunit M